MQIGYTTVLELVQLIGLSLKVLNKAFTNLSNPEKRGMIKKAKSPNLKRSKTSTIGTPT